MSRSVIVLGGLISPIGQCIVDRLLSQRYGVCIVDVISNGVCGRNPSRWLSYHHYDPGIPGDFDFVVREILRKKSTFMKFFAFIDLGCVRRAESVSYDPLAAMAPNLEDLARNFIYILLHTSPVCEKKLAELSPFAQHTYLLEIPKYILLNTPEHGGGSNYIKRFTGFQNGLKNHRIVWVNDVARLVCDHLLRYPPGMKGKYLRFKIEGHPTVRSIPPDLLVVLHTTETDRSNIPIYENLQCLSRFTCLSDCHV